MISQISRWDTVILTFSANIGHIDSQIGYMLTAASRRVQEAGNLVSITGFDVGVH